MGFVDLDDDSKKKKPKPKKGKGKKPKKTPRGTSLWAAKELFDFTTGRKDTPGNYTPKGLASNFGKDLGAAATGLPVAAKNLTQSLIADTKTSILDSGEFAFGDVPRLAGARSPVQNKNRKYRTDDLAKETIQATAYQYAPLKDGDYKEFARRTYEHPLGPVLDALTLATLGAGGAAQGAKLAAQAGGAGSRSARLASRVTGSKVTKVDDASDALIDLRTARGTGSRFVGTKLDDTTILAPGQRQLLTRAERKNLGLKAGRGDRSNIPGARTVGEYSENPFRRMQQRARDAISETFGTSTYRITQADRKDVRNNRLRDERIQGIHATAESLNKTKLGERLGLGMGVAGRLLSKDAELQVAVRNELQGLDPADEAARLTRESRALNTSSTMPERAYDYARSLSRGAKDIKTAAQAEMAVLRSQELRAKDDLKKVAQPHEKRLADATEINRIVSDRHDDMWHNRGDDAELVDTAYLWENGWYERDGKLVRLEDAKKADDALPVMGWSAKSDEFTADVKERGFDTPIDAQLKNDKLVITDGMSRLLAAKRAGVATPVRLTVGHDTAQRRGKMVPENTGLAETNRPPIFAPPGDWGLPVLDRQAIPVTPKTVKEAQRRLRARLKEIDRRKKVARRLASDGKHSVEKLGQLVKARRNVEFITPRLEGRIATQTKLATEGLSSKQAKVFNRMLELVGRTGLDNTKQIKANAAARGAAGPRDEIVNRGVETGVVTADGPGLVTRERTRGDGRELTNKLAERKRAELAASGEYRAPVPTSMDRKDAAKYERAEEKRAKNLAAPGIPASSKMRTGFNERFALDSTKPQNLIAVNKVQRLFAESMATWDKIMQSAVHVENGTQPPKGYRLVPGSRLNHFMDQAEEFLDVDAPVIFDDPNAIRLMRKNVYDKMKLMGQDGPIAVPESLYNSFTRELKPAKRIPVIDEMTSVWRAGVVSALRPAFIANNILGQTALLAMAHTNLKSFRALVQYSTDKNLRQEMRKSMGAVEGSGSAAVLGRQTGDIIEGSRLPAAATEKIRNMNDAVGRFGQAISDDPFRRIAFAMEVLPAGRKIAKKEGISPYEGMKRVLDNPKSMDRIERKVLDDLVDFDDLSHTERAAIRRVLPFYSWIKGSSKIAVRNTLNAPLKTDILAKMGQEEYERLMEEYGGVNEFILNSIPIDRRGDVRKIMNTASWNPALTPVDTAQQIQSLLAGPEQGKEIGSDNPAASFNPVIKGAMGLLGTPDPFTGEAQGDGIAGAAKGFVNAFPQAQGLSKAYPTMPFLGRPELTPEQVKSIKESRLYQTSPSNELFKYLGSPLRYLNVPAAQKKYRNPTGMQFAKYPLLFENSEGDQAATYTPITLPDGNEVLIRSALWDPDKKKKKKG